MFPKSVLFSLCLIVFIHIDYGQTLEVESIQGGQKAHIYNYPYQVSLKYQSQNICGGSIIDESYIVTAAACIVNNNCRLAVESLKVVAGTSNWKYSVGQIREVQRVYLNPHYNPTTLFANIAILRLKQPLKIGIHLYTFPLSLPKKDGKYAGKQATLTSFGYEYNPIVGAVTGQSTSGNLLSIETKIMSNSDCQNKYLTNTPFYKKSKKILTIFKEFLCASTKKSESGPCYGDVGSPLVVKGTLVGIVSQFSQDCDEAMGPSIYTRVSSFLGFIDKAIYFDQTCRTTANEYFRFCDMPGEERGHGANINLLQYACPVDAYVSTVRLL